MQKEGKTSAYLIEDTAKMRIGDIASSTNKNINTKNIAKKPENQILKYITTSGKQIKHFSMELHFFQFLGAMKYTDEVGDGIKGIKKAIDKVDDVAKGELDIPKPKSFNNFETRRWYLEQET